MERDRNLLFGIFAVQLGKVSPHQLVRAGGAWASDPQKSLNDVLCEIGAMRNEDARLIKKFVDEAVRAHANDPSKTLDAFGGSGAIERSFHGSVALSDSGLFQTTATAPSDEFDPSRTVEVPETPGRYSHVREHAKGGMGRILLVHDEEIGRDVALKELLPEARGSSVTTVEQGGTQPKTNPHLEARFLQEAKITGQLEHPAIVPVYELGRREDGSVYYTMKLVRGRTLAEAIRGARSLEERLQLLPHFVDLCQAISYAHSRGVIHRDIKPRNVMIGQFGETVVLDWGLAKAEDTDDVVGDELAETLSLLAAGDRDAFLQTAYGQAMGTPAYMAPEQARGEVDLIDERTDVYALGVVLYELLTGKVPFRGTTIMETLDLVLGEPPPPIHKWERRAPAELAAIAMRALQKDPSARYESVSEMLHDVSRYQAGIQVHAHRYRLRDHVGRYRRRMMAGLNAIVAVAAVAIVGSVLISVSGKSPLSSSDQTVKLSKNIPRALSSASSANSVETRPGRDQAQIDQANREAEEVRQKAEEAAKAEEERKAAEAEAQRRADEQAALIATAEAVARQAAQEQAAQAQAELERIREEAEAAQTQLEQERAAREQAEREAEAARMAAARAAANKAAQDAAARKAAQAAANRAAAEEAAAKEAAEAEAARLVMLQAAEAAQPEFPDISGQWHAAGTRPDADNRSRDIEPDVKIYTDGNSVRITIDGKELIGQYSGGRITGKLETTISAISRSGKGKIQIPEIWEIDLVAQSDHRMEGTFSVTHTGFQASENSKNGTRNQSIVLIR